jgi:hypothetical protein
VVWAWHPAVFWIRKNREIDGKHRRWYNVVRVE